MPIKSLASEKLLSKEFHCRIKGHKLDGIRRLLSIESYFFPVILLRCIKAWVFDKNSYFGP